MEEAPPILELSAVNLADLALALEDHSEEQSWWFDPVDGTVAPFFSWSLENPSDRSALEDLIPVEPLPSSVGYADMGDFAARVRDPQARELLEGALKGRGAFRRFKDLLELDFPELRGAWFAFHDVRAERRAIQWLVQRKLISAEAAEQALAQRPDPQLEGLPGLLDADAVARRVANDLRRFYRERLKGVLLIGAWARGDAHPESALELVVVLDRISDRWEERRRLDRVMWRHSVRNNTVIQEQLVTEDELRAKPAPRLTYELLEGVRVA
jgi:uncharacterized protein UPF0158